MNKDWPGGHAYGYVRRGFVTGVYERDATLLPCVLYGLCSVPGRALMVHVLLENGASYARVPIHALSHTPHVTTWRPLSDCQLWDCFAYEFEVHRYSYLRDRRVQVLPLKAWATYIGTVDWQENGYSDEPVQHKQAHLVALDSGQFGAYPNNLLRWEDLSFTDWRQPVRLARNTRTWHAERREIMHDDDCPCPECQEPMDPPAWPSHYLIDANGQQWLRCGPQCDMEPREDGGVRCRCHE